MTDFNNKAPVGSPLYVGSKKSADLPLDARTRIDNLAEMDLITFPYVGMLVYVRDEGKFYVVKSLKGEEVKPGVPSTYIDNYKIDEYEEFNNFTEDQLAGIQALGRPDDASTPDDNEATGIFKRVETLERIADIIKPEMNVIPKNEQTLFEAGVDVISAGYPITIAISESRNPATSVAAVGQVIGSEDTVTCTITQDSDNPNTYIATTDADITASTNIYVTVEVDGAILESILSFVFVKAIEVGPEYDKTLYPSADTSEVEKILTNQKELVHTVDITVPSKMTIKYDKNLGPLLEIRDSNTHMDLIDGFELIETEDDCYKYVMLNDVVIRDTFIFKFN